MQDKSIINIDFQGWPVHRMCVRNIIMALGARFNNETNKFEIDNNGELLNAYPCVLEDDGMGYGINERYITELSVFKDKDETKCVNIFAEKALPEEELDKLFGTNYADKDDVIKLTPSNNDENLHI